MNSLPTVPDPRQSLLDVGLAEFDVQGYAGATVSGIRKASGVSNGSFFHHFGSKEGLAGAIFVMALKSYHAHLLDGLAARRSAAAGVERLVRRHVQWVVEQRPAARFMYEQHRAEWLGSFRHEQATENASFAAGVEAWRAPFARSGELADLPGMLFFSQLVGPAQMVCRAWLSGSGDDPTPYVPALVRLATRALVNPARTVARNRKTP